MRLVVGLPLHLDPRAVLDRDALVVGTGAGRSRPLRGHTGSR